MVKRKNREAERTACGYRGTGWHSADMQNKSTKQIRRDAVIVLASVGAAIVLGWSGVIPSFLSATEGSRMLGSFIAGLFFTSVFTTAFATVALAQIAQVNSIFFVALFGGAGAVIGDLIIFRFMRDHIAEDIAYLLQTSRPYRWSALLHLRSARWFMTFLGAVIVASPLPDELGLALMGLSKLPTAYFIPLSFLLNAIGILVIGLIAKVV